MTFSEAKLLGKLKKAQIIKDNCVYIDFDNLTVITVHTANDKYVTVDLDKFSSDLHSILKSLEDKELIEVKGNGYLNVTYSGWNAYRLTVQDAIKFTVRDILVPIIVSIITVVLTELLLKSF